MFLRNVLHISFRIKNPVRLLGPLMLLYIILQALELFSLNTRDNSANESGVKISSDVRLEAQTNQRLGVKCQHRCRPRGC